MQPNPKSRIQNPKPFDVLIVGAGPAGSLAAEILARNNVSTALFDGRPANKPKPCGGGVTAKALKAYPQLLQAVGRKIEDLEMFAPSGKKLHLKLDEPFSIYSRGVFDAFLRDRAVSAGATLISAKVVLDSEQNGDWILRGYGDNEQFYTGKFLVAADGANSAIAKKLSGNLAKSEMEMAFGYRLPITDADADLKTTIAFLPDYDGYAWAFPRVSNISFGIATAQENFNHERLDHLLWQFIIGFERHRQNPAQKIWQDLNAPENIKLKSELLEKSEKYAARIPGLSPETLENRWTCGTNWALLGDAAGFADAVTGEGIYYALRSAELFADCHLRGENYETAWRADFGAELKRAAKMRQRFYGNFFGASFTERMIQIAAVHGGIKKTLRELVAGEQGYTDLKRKLTRRAFLPFAS